MGFYNKYEYTPTLDVNGTILEVHDGCLSSRALPPAVRGFKLVDVIPKVKGTTTIMQSLSDLVDITKQGYINYRFINGLELTCNLTFSSIDTPLQIAIFAADGHRAKININGNTDYTATTVAEYLDKYIKYVNSANPKYTTSKKHDKLMEKLDNMNLPGGQPWGDGIYYIVENDGCLSYDAPCKIHYGLNCSIRPTKDDSKAQIVFVEYDEAYNGDVCIYNNTKIRTKDLPYTYSNEQYKNIITKIATKYRINRRNLDFKNPSFAQAWEKLKVMPCFKLNDITLCLGTNNGKSVEARYKDNDILVKLANNHIIHMSKALPYFTDPLGYYGEDTIIRLIKFIALAELYSPVNFNFERYKDQ